jgi:hypothetical protein
MTDDVEWRLAAMLAQIRPSAPIPLLVVRPGESAWPSQRGRCLSCGDPLALGSRCPACVEAAALAIRRARG